MKSCTSSKCKNKNPQPFSEFFKNIKKKDGYQNECRSCLRVRSRDWVRANPNKTKVAWKKARVRNPDMQRAGWLKREYGITVERYEEMRASQGGCCYICKTHESVFRRRLQVDHCHKTGMVRDLLCTNCNMLIGASKESPGRLLAAIAYLDRHR